jgi:hypothetical protein
MNRLRCFLFATAVVISSATLALGGDMQVPGKSDPPPPASAAATESTTDGILAPTLTEQTQIASQDLTTTMIWELLLAIY